MAIVKGSDNFWIWTLVTFVRGMSDSDDDNGIESRLAKHTRLWTTGLPTGAPMATLCHEELC